MKTFSHISVLFIALLGLTNTASAAIFYEAPTPISNWAVVVSGSGESAFGESYNAVEDGNALVTQLTGRYGYSASQVIHLRGEYVTSNQVFKEIVSLAKQMGPGDSIAIFLLVDIRFDYTSGPMLVTGERERLNEGSLPISAISDVLQKASLSDIFIFSQSCLEREQENVKQFSSRMIQRSYPQNSLSRTSMLYGCQLVPVRNAKTIRTSLIDTLAENNRQVITLVDLYRSMRSELSHYEIQYQSGMSKRPFQFVLSAAKLDEDAVAQLTDSTSGAIQRKRALRNLYDSVFAEYRSGNGGPLAELQDILISLATTADEDIEVKRDSVKTLAALPGEIAFESLKKVVTSEEADSETKSMALTQLGYLGTPESDEIIVHFVSDSNKSLRQAALSIVGIRSLAEAVGPIFEQLQKETDLMTKESELEILENLLSEVSISQHQLDVLHAIATDVNEDESIRISAISTIGTVGNESSLDAVKDIAQGAQSVELREVATYSMGRLGRTLEQDAKDFVIVNLQALLDDDSVRVRTAAIYSLGQLHARAASAALVDILKSSQSSTDLKIASIEAIGEIKYTGAVRQLGKALKHDDQVLRLTAVRALQQIGTKKAARALVTAFADDVDFVRAAALEAYQDFDFTDLDISSELKDAVKSAKDPRVKALYLERLSAINDDDIVEILIDSMYDNDDLVVNTALEGLASSPFRDRVMAELGQLAFKDDDRDQLVAIHALASIDDPNSVAILVELLNGGERDLRVELLKALGNHASDNSIEAVKGRVGRNNLVTVTALDALSNIGTIFYANDEYERVISLVTYVISERNNILDRNDPALALDYNNLGAAYQKMGNLDIAEEMLLRAVRIQTSLDFEGVDLATTLSNLGYLYMTKGDLLREENGDENVIADLYIDAENAFVSSLSIRTGVVGPEHELTAESYDNLELVNKRLGLEPQAEMYAEQADMIRKSSNRLNRKN